MNPMPPPFLCAVQQLDSAPSIVNSAKMCSQPNFVRLLDLIILQNKLNNMIQKKISDYIFCGSLADQEPPRLYVQALFCSTIHLWALAPFLQPLIRM